MRVRLEELSRGSFDPTTTVSGATNPIDRLASGVFVGREAEVERARAVLDESLSGTPHVLLVVGEPGIGKTRVSEELTTYARMRGAHVHWGRCHEGEGAPPFWPWVQLTRGYAEGSDARPPARPRTGRRAPPRGSV